MSRGPNYHATPDYVGEFCPREDLSRDGELLAACYEAGWSFGTTGDRYYFRIGRVAMTQAAAAGMRALGRADYLEGMKDGAIAERATRRRVGGAS